MSTNVNSALFKATGMPKTEFHTGATRDNQVGKGRYDLLPPEAIRRIAIRFEEGARRHGDRNWERGIPMNNLLGSAMRHLLQYLDGCRDEDHLAAAGWNVMAAIHMEREIAMHRVSECMDGGIAIKSVGERQNYLRALGYNAKANDSGENASPSRSTLAR